MFFKRNKNKNKKKVDPRAEAHLELAGLLNEMKAIQEALVDETDIKQRYILLRSQRALRRKARLIVVKIYDLNKACKEE